MIKTKETRPKKIKNLTVEFFVNPPEGPEHGLKLSKLKIWNHIYFKNFWKIAFLMVGQKNFQVKIDSFIDFVSFQIPDLNRY